MSTDDTRPDGLVLPADEMAALKSAARMLAGIVARNSLVLEAARIEMLQNGPHAGMQWVLNSAPDLWDDDSTAWDGHESAQSWFDRTDAAYRAAEAAVSVPAVTSPAPAPAKPPATATEPGRGNGGGASSSPLAASREALGRLVHDVRLATEDERAEAEGRQRFSLGGWDERTDHQRELDMQIGEAVAAAERERDAGDRAAAEANIARLGIHVDRLGKEHARHALAVSAHKARADQQESRAIHAEKMLARFARHAEEYDALAAQAAQGYRNANLVTELRRRIAVLERSMARAVEPERARIRRGILGIETVLERPGTGESVVAVETMALEVLIGPEDGSAVTGTGEEPFTADVGRPSAADREMAARATGGGIRGREVKPEFSEEEAGNG